MARTTIENLDACACIQRYDSPEAFFYIAPPYWDADFYAVSFKGDDFLGLRDTLMTIPGGCVLLHGIEEKQDSGFRKTEVKLKGVRR
jgi:DNA adenine methylase